MNDIDQIARGEFLKQTNGLAADPYILQQLDYDLRTSGFAGKTNIPQLIYLSAITAAFEKPVSVVIKGESGSGKSFALQSGLRYLPSTAYQEVHGMSAKALLYAAKSELKHKMLIIQEAAGFNADGWAYLRQLLSEGRLTYKTVVQTKDGPAGKELPTVEGPVGLFMTTTQNRLHPEDETRFLSVYVDQSREQIRRAIMSYGDAESTARATGLVAEFHALFEYVRSGPKSVVIPYRRRLLELFPDSYPRVLRDIPKVMALIEAHALLHQELRAKKGGAVEAHPEDYAAVHKLIGDALAVGLQAIVPPHIVEVVRAVEAMHELLGEAVSQVEVAQYLDREQSAVSRNLRTAVGEGYVENRNPGQGKEHAYVPGKRSLPTKEVLPHPDRLFGTPARDTERSFGPA
ncbi:hypothetical protein [Bradyrhizobium sp. RP6]|uniref:hypothetical protein n=1 Tax=Bradyrhizobium sp. RP6 TaxID=2489596 RepID=UPI000F546D15|nr:hypothetical protein [Bradyrhizobium sp. RP6]RQH12748.1 hypothetical protein EHH60_14780 [Bradyrhizobium sp. RP6]